MVRINLIDPKKLADQHLVAEYNEILMLLGYVKKYPSDKDIPKNYCLGKGHIRFFKNKLKYIEDRHEKIKKEMKRRNFQTNKTIDLSIFNKELINNWSPKSSDFKIIKSGLKEKINNKPEYYRYFSKKKDIRFFENLIS